VLPIVQRELQVAARSSRLYKGRLRTGLLVIAIASFILLAAQGVRQAGATFQVLATITLLLCWFEGVRKTADSISIEKRERTLGLLFLSTLSGFDIILGKLSASAVRSLSTLLAFVPILAISLLLGGTTGGEFWRAVLALVLTMFASLCLCLFISTLAGERALIVSLILLLALAILPFPIGALLGKPPGDWILPLSPFHLLVSASDSYYTFNPQLFWRGVIYLALLASASVALAGFILPHVWQDKPALARQNPRLTGRLTPRLVNRRRAMLDRNPIMWLTFNPRSHDKFRVFLFILVVLIVLCTIAALYIANAVGNAEVAFIIPAVGLGLIALVSTVRVARSTSRNFAEARSNGALELILSTPVKVRHILAGQWLAIRMDLLPALVLFIGLGVLVIFVPVAIGETVPALWILKGMAEATLGIATVAAVGVWMGLTSKTPGRAFFKTVALGFLAPYLLLCIPTLVVQLVILLFALDKVEYQFRRFVAEQYLAPSGLASIPQATPNLPPVIR
jgi:ABC-type transport system involved in multi-copper enzyme maturation permease subunit